MNKFLDGYKTILAGIGGVLVAVGYFLTEGLKDGLQVGDITTLVAGIAASLGLLGIGGKLQKLIDALKK